MPVYRRTRDTEPQLSGRRLRAHRGGELDRRRAKGTNDYFIKRMKNQECASGTARHKHTAHKGGGLVCASNTVLRSCDMSSRLQSSDPIRSTHLHRWRDFENLSSPDALRTIRAVRHGRETFYSGPGASPMHERRVLPTTMRTSER
jgi:hypothetical protein